MSSIGEKVTELSEEIERLRTELHQHKQTMKLARKKASEISPGKAPKIKDVIEILNQVEGV